jgi:hypothetical protein
MTLFTLYRMTALTVDQLSIGTTYTIRPAPYSVGFFGIYRGSDGDLRRFEIGPNHILYLQPFMEVFAIADGAGGSVGASGSGGSVGASGSGGSVGSGTPTPPVINNTSPTISNIRNVNPKQRLNRRSRSHRSRRSRSRRNNNASV